MAGKQFDSLEVRELIVSGKWVFVPATDPTATQGGWSVTNKTSDRSIDCNNNDPLINGDVLGTLIDDLIAKGILKA